MTLEALLVNVNMMMGMLDYVIDEEGTLQKMKGKPMVIEMKDDIQIKPVQMCSPK